MPNAQKTQQKPNLISSSSVPELLEVIEPKDHIIAEQQKLLRLLEE